MNYVGTANKVVRLSVFFALFFGRAILADVALIGWVQVNHLSGVAAPNVAVEVCCRGNNARFPTDTINVCVRQTTDRDGRTTYDTFAGNIVPGTAMCSVSATCWYTLTGRNNDRAFFYPSQSGAGAINLMSTVDRNGRRIDATTNLGGRTITMSRNEWCQDLRADLPSGDEIGYCSIESGSALEEKVY